MKIFVTGGSGWVGSHIIPLLAPDHTITALSRSSTSAAKITALGATPLQGDLTDHALLAKAASEADAVIHLGFNHDFGNPKYDFAQCCKDDAEVVMAMGQAMNGTDKIFINTSGTLMFTRLGRPLDETMDRPPSAARDECVDQLRALGLRAFAIRLSPTTYGEGDKGVIPMLISLARQHGVSAYLGDANVRWSASHVRDAANLYRRVLETAASPSAPVQSLKYYHAAAEESVPYKAIAELIGKRIGVEAKALSEDELGSLIGPLMAIFLLNDSPASAELTKKQTGWEPKEKGVIESLETSKVYFA